MIANETPFHQSSNDVQITLHVKIRINNVMHGYNGHNMCSMNLPIKISCATTPY